jgi:V/A-type H+-transporting ATPase subunit C
MRLIPRTFTDPIVYGYATGRVKVLETKLFTKPRVERLVQADDLAEQLNILAETDYGEFFEDVRTAEDIEEALNKYLAKIYDFLDEVCKKAVIIKFFRLKYDYHNLKVLLKTKYLGKDAERIWSYLGLLNVEEAKEYIQEGAPENLPEPYSSDVKQAMEGFEEKKDSQEIDIALDRGLYQEWYKIAQSLRNQFLIDFVKIAIDLANLRTFLRAKNLGRKSEFIVRALFDNGSIEKEILISLYLRPLNDLVSELSNTFYGPILSTVIKEKDKIDLELLDKAADNFLLGYAKKAKLVAVGPEPLVGYILAKENEVSAIRIILTEKLNGLPTQVIEERVRELYV